MFVIICLLFSSCATIINGPDQKVTILSDPAGADIEINGVEAGKTPSTFRIVRAKDHEITLSKEGYHVHTVKLERSISAVSAFYILPGGLLSAAIDTAEGSIFCFPDDVNVAMLPLFDPDFVVTSHINQLKSAATMQVECKGQLPQAQSIQ